MTKENQNPNSKFLGPWSKNFLFLVEIVAIPTDYNIVMIIEV